MFIVKHTDIEGRCPAKVIITHMEIDGDRYIIAGEIKEDGMIMRYNNLQKSKQD